jgi:hypothetical protein
MASAVLAVEKVERLDWITRPVRSVIELLPLVLESRREIIENGYEFVLRCSSQPPKYFVRFRNVRPGIVSSTSLEVAARVSSVACALSFFAFIQRETQASAKDFFVEAVQVKQRGENKCLSPRPMFQRKKKLIVR